MQIESSTIQPDNILCKYLNDKIKSISADFHKMDIINNTNTNIAIKIAESRGFRIIKKVDKFSRYENKDALDILMYNDKTGAFLHAPKALSDNFCYSGCSLSFIAPHGHDLFLGGSSSPINKELRDYKETYHEGLFSTYDTVSNKIKCCNSEFIKSNVSKINYSFPIPEYIDDINVSQWNYKEVLNLLPKTSDFTLDFYRMHNTINLLLAKYDNELSNSGCPIYECLQEDETFAKKLKDTIGLYPFNNIEGSLNILYVAFSYLQIPDEEAAKIINNLREVLKENDKNEDRIHEKVSILKLFDDARKDFSLNHDSVNEFFDFVKIPELKQVAQNVNIPWEIDLRKNLCKEDMSLE